MSTGNMPFVSAHPLTASANVRNTSGGMLGIFVSAASATPTITVYDDAGMGTASKLVDTFTPVAGTWYPLPFAFGSGLYVVLSGTVSCTVGLI